MRPLYAFPGEMSRKRVCSSIGALQDSTRETISNATRATSRTNFGIVETSGEPATVRVSVSCGDSQKFARPSGLIHGLQSYCQSRSKVRLGAAA